MKHQKRFASILLGLVLITSLATPAFASGKTGSLTLHYVLSNHVFRLFHVATFTPDGEFQLNDDYKKLSIDWSDMENEDWYELANNLDTMVVAKKIAADRTVTSDKKGTATVEDLPYGLWLIAGDTEIRDRVIYTTQPLLVSIPGASDDGTVNSARELTISKYSRETKPDPIQISVVKVWNDNHYSARPKNIQVTLWCDAQSYDTVILNSDNNWRYSWNNLEKNHSWRIAEDVVPDGYTVSYSHDNYAFYITNTKPTPPTPPPEIPQTGVNWSCVIILFSLSLICLIVGVWRRKQSEE